MLLYGRACLYGQAHARTHARTRARTNTDTMASYQFAAVTQQRWTPEHAMLGTGIGSFAQISLHCHDILTLHGAQSLAGWTAAQRDAGHVVTNADETVGWGIGPLAMVGTSGRAVYQVNSVDGPDVVRRQPLTLSWLSCLTVLAVCPSDGLPADD